MSDIDTKAIRNIILVVAVILILGFLNYSILQYWTMEESSLQGCPVCKNETIIKETIIINQTCEKTPIPEVISTPTLTQDRISFYLENLIAEVKNTPCYENRLAKDKPDKQFFEYAISPSEVSHWGGNEFLIKTDFELMRLPKALDKATHLMRYDVETKMVVHCDDPISFDYASFPLLKDQKSPRNY